MSKATTSVKTLLQVPILHDIYIYKYDNTEQLHTILTINSRE